MQTGPSRRRLLLWLSLSFRVGFLLLAPGLWAQSAVDGAIAGRITDPRGDSIFRAAIKVENADLGVSREVFTQADGRFFLPKLVPGSYRLSVLAAGFDTITQDVTVTLGLVSTMDRRLTLAQVLTLINVDPAPINLAPSVEETFPGGPPSSSASQQTATVEQVEVLPIEGRRWQSFALLLPGTSGGSAADGESTISFRGIATTQNSSEIDGASGDQSFGSVAQGSGLRIGHESEVDQDSGSSTGVGGDGARSMRGRHAGAAYIFSQAAVQEFRVHTGTYSALDGHAAGGVVTTISKGGTNTMKGSLFYLARDSAWGSTNPFSTQTTYSDGVTSTALVKPRDFRQQFGGSLGGPVPGPRRKPAHDAKLFYFVALDAQRRDFPAISSPGYAAFYALTATQQALLGNRGVSVAKTTAALNYLNSLSGTVDRKADQQIAFGKLDWQLSKKNRLSMQENHVRWNLPAGVRSEPVVDRGLASIGNALGKVDAGIVRWVDLWSSHLSNEVRVAYGRDIEYETPQLPLAQEPAIGIGGFSPEVSIGPNGFVFGTPASLGRKAYPDEHRFQVAELLQWVRGRHLVQFGADLSQVHDHVDSLTNEVGTFLYDSGATGGKAGGLVDWITDYTFSANAYPNGACPSINARDHLFCFRTYTQSFGEQDLRFHTREWAAFLQDEWRVRPGLHLSAGVRYEYQTQPTPQQPNSALDIAFASRGSTSAFPRDTNNAGPRAGLAWQPFGSGKGTVRLGYGVYFGRLPGATIRSALINTALPSSTRHVRITPATVTGCPQVANQGFGYGCAYVASPPAAVSATTSASLFDRRFRLPMVQQGTFELERNIRGVAFTASYVMNLDRQLPDSVDINIAPSTASRQFQLQGGPTRGSGIAGVRSGDTFVVPFYTDRLSSEYGPVTDIISSANGTYNALVLAAQRRSRKGIEFRAAWTWSKAIDYGQDNSAVPETNGQFDPYVNGYDKGLSTLNFSHKVTASAVFEPTPHLSRTWLQRTAGDWQVAPLLVVSSGRPYSYEIFGGTRLTGGHTSINGSGGAVYLPTVGRNTLRLPDTVHLDLRVGRTVRLSERVNLKASADIFNLPNKVNYSSTTTRAYLEGDAVGGVTPLIFQDAKTIASEGLNTQPFGAFTAASTSNSRERQVQLGIKLEF